MADLSSPGGGPPRNGEPAEILAWLVPVLTRLAPNYPNPLTEETPLADGGLCLDSLVFMELIGMIEAAFGVTVADDDISLEHLGSVGQTTRFLQAKLEAGIAHGESPAKL